MTQNDIAIGFIAKFTNYQSDNWKGVTMAKSMNQINLEIMERTIGSKLFNEICVTMPGGTHLYS